MPTDDDLVQQGMAIFRAIAGRSRVGLCAKRIARDRYCPARKASNFGLFCERHDRQVAADDRLEAALEMVLKAACHGCARGTDEHWPVCVEARQMVEE